MIEEKALADYCIQIDFKKDSEAPSRIFRALSDLIDAFYLLDIDLVQSIDPKIKPIILLEDIEAGSVKTWLKYVLEEVDDDALKKLDWKTAVGKYLVKGKYLLINFLEGKTKITNREQLQQIENGLLKLAQETHVDHVLAYAPMPPQKLIQNLERITKATSHLIEGDKLNYITRDAETNFNLDFQIVPESVEDLITKEEIDATIEMILKVKKPDYLGESKWECKHENRTILVKISDINWLKQFQNREIDVRPQDSIRARVHITTKYGYDLNVVSINYDIVEVIEIIPYSYPGQDLLF